MTERVLAEGTQALAFGPFRLLPVQGVLLEADKPVRLGSRALDILSALVEHAGQLVSKDELIARAWPETVVEEANLRVHIASLRKVLGDGRSGARYIVNVSGRGYRFVAPVAQSRDTEAPAAWSPAVADGYNLPAPLTRMIGRAESVSAIATQLTRRRFVTIVGPGGIGKTTVALAVAEKLHATYEQGAAFVDLASVTDLRLVAGALASVLGLSINSENPTAGAVGFLREKRMLVVIDTCEHVISAVAALAEAVLKGAPGVHMLATSREPLRAEGEWVHRLPSLECPPQSAQLTVDQALEFPAIALFAERGLANLETYELTDADVAVVIEICRRLDGIPLAIELAAAVLDSYSVRELAARLDDRFRLLTRGRRTALPRHQTLRATLDWSYEILSDCEKAILRRLAVFNGGFTLEAAAAVAADENVSACDVPDHVTTLGAKSLVTADVSGDVVRYRLLDMTRSYALEKLEAAGELQAISRRHAEYYREVFERAGAQLQMQPADEWLGVYGHHIDNLRAALDWAFSADGDEEIGVALTAAAVPLWMHLSLMQESRTRVELALARDSARDKRHTMQLNAALGLALMYTKGAAQDTHSALTSALAAAEELHDTDYQLRALWGLCVDRLNNGVFREALEFAEAFYRIAQRSSDPLDLPIGERMIGFSLHYLGAETRARHHLERMLRRYRGEGRRSHIIRFQFDLRVTAQIILGEIFWLQGYPDQATRTIKGSIEEAIGLRHTISLCNALAKACPVALMLGDLAAAERFLQMLLEHSTRNALLSWQAEARCFQSVLMIKRGDLANGVAALREALEELRGMSFSLRYAELLGELADGLCRVGELEAAQRAIDEALARAENNEERWCLAELLRIKGEIVHRAQGAGAATLAERHFRRALETARQQEQLSWELRAAMSLAELLQATDRRKEALELLSAIYARFTEGFLTSDLLRADALLRKLGVDRARA
jgi:predicted ATPase/DNA-binding winged helix-turn-helix (wHTH) protein